MPAGVSAWTPLANLTLSTTPSTVTFSSINQGYRDLVLVINAANNDSRGGDLWLQVNGDSSGNYRNVWMQANYSAKASSANTSSRININNLNISSSTSKTAITFQANDYSATDKNKSFLTKADNALIGTSLSAGLWTSNSAITSISISIEWGFAVGSTFALYGVSA